MVAAFVFKIWMVLFITGNDNLFQLFNKKCWILGVVSVHIYCHQPSNIFYHDDRHIFLSFVKGSFAVSGGTFEYVLHMYPW